MYICRKLSVAVVFVVLASISGLTAQGSYNNSPYSRFGLGDLLSQDLASTSGMGGVSSSYHTYQNLNFVNPASLGHLRLTAFELGGFYETANMKDQNGHSARRNNGGLSYIALGFPITKKWTYEVADSVTKKKMPQWGMGFALLPHSNVSYKVLVQDSIQMDQPGREYADVRKIYSGKGSRYRFTWSNAVRFKDLSVGLSMSYFFGKIINSDSVGVSETDHVLYGYYSVFEKDRFYSAMNVRGGVTYDIPIKQNKVRDLRTLITLSAYGETGTKIREKSLEISYRAGGSYAQDTILYTENNVRSLNMPGVIGGGIAYQSNKLHLGVGFEMGFWEKYSSQTANTTRISVGAEWIPAGKIENRKRQSFYLKRMKYRFGGYYATDPRLASVTSAPDQTYQLRRMAATFGLGIPVFEKPSKQRWPAEVNLGFEIGKSGHPDLIDETYFRLSVGFTLNDIKWFAKPKFR